MSQVGLPQMAIDPFARWLFLGSGLGYRNRHDHDVSLDYSRFH